MKDLNTLLTTQVYKRRIQGRFEQYVISGSLIMCITVTVFQRKPNTQSLYVFSFRSRNQTFSKSPVATVKMSVFICIVWDNDFQFRPPTLQAKLPDAGYAYTRLFPLSTLHHICFIISRRSNCRRHRRCVMSNVVGKGARTIMSTTLFDNQVVCTF